MLVPAHLAPTPACIAADLSGPTRSPRVLQDRAIATVLAAFFAVHRELGGGFLAAVYQRALSLELSLRGVPFEQDVPLSVSYKGTRVGHFRAPLVVSARVVVEVCAAPRIDASHERALSNCLRASMCESGLLLNFGIAASFRHLER